jgi:hypothetical protein
LLFLQGNKFLDLFYVKREAFPWLSCGANALDFDFGFDIDPDDWEVRRQSETMTQWSRSFQWVVAYAYLSLLLRFSLYHNFLQLLHSCRFYSPHLIAQRWWQDFNFLLYSQKAIRT